MRVAYEKELQAAETQNLLLQERNEILESTIIEVKISLMNKDEQLREQAANAQELELQRHELERQPESSSANAQREKEYLLSKALAIAQHEAQRNYSRMRDLSDALQATPNQVANIKGLLEEKDLELFKLEKKALLCQAELIRAERDARFFRTVTMDKLFDYHKQLDNAMGTIKFLEERRSGYQQECEHLLKILRNKVTQLGYMESLEHCQQLLLNDQQLLEARLKAKDIEIAYAEDKAGLLEGDLRELRHKIEIKEQGMSELEGALACKIGDNLLLKTKVSNLVHSSAARFEHYDTLLEMKQQEIMRLDSIRQLSDQTPDLTGRLGLEEKFELVLKDKDERIEELEKSVDELRNENNECLDELGGLREVSATNAEDAVYARYYLDMALSELRAVDEDRFYKLKQGLTETHKIQSLQARLGEAQEEAKEKHSIYEDKLEKLQRYAGVIRGLGFDLISRFQGDETSLEKWSFEDMFEVLNSQAHLLNEKGKSRAGAPHESGVEEHLIDRYKDGRIHSCRNGQGARSDEVKANVPGRQFKLDGHYNDVETLPSGEGHRDEHGGALFSGGRHNYDRDRPLFSSDLYTFENCGPLFSGKFCLPNLDKSSESGTPPWPPYGSDGIPATEDIEEFDEVGCTTSVGSQHWRH